MVSLETSTDEVMIHAAVADIREMNEFGDERTTSRDPDANSRPEPETSPRADSLKGEYLVSFEVNSICQSS